MQVIFNRKVRAAAGVVFKVGAVEDIDPALAETLGDAVASLEGNKDSLVQVAVDHGLRVTDGMTKREILDLIAGGPGDPDHPDDLTDPDDPGDQDLGGG